MKKVVLKVLIISILSFSHINYVTARSGCCSYHGGVAGCSSSGRQICNDGTLSPSCTYTPTYIYVALIAVQKIITLALIKIMVVVFIINMGVQI